MKREKITSTLKAKVAIDALKGHQTVNQIAAEFEVHPSLVNAWKKQLLEASVDIFSQGRKQRTESVEKGVYYDHINDDKWVVEMNGYFYDDIFTSGARLGLQR